MLRKFAVLSILPAVLAAPSSDAAGDEPGERDHEGFCREKRATAKDASKAADDLPGLKELNAADRKLAEQQRVCPVSGNPIGTAGMIPYK